ncbi:UNVERIFIED_CONTAM: hypothetical protein GTU68_066393, partial [Idotea baltica]|nr:hypothetical protein [Idotea baltica]
QSSFTDLKLSPNLLSVLGELGYETPTPIQVGAIPALLNGRDFVGQSKTGSGKTAAFALPILQALQIESRALQALVLCPTRELCAQVARETRKLGRAQGGLRVLELVGGQPSRPQREALERGVHFAVGTPGRLLDHLQREFLDPRDIRTVVLDEADRMLDMGFGDDVNEILHYLPPNCQTALFSATLVATDVAGRGLDVKGLDLVVNYELPPQPETYVHRIGRTGRAGSQGVAVSLSRGHGDERMEAAEQLVGTTIQTVAHSELSDGGVRKHLDSLTGDAPMATILISGGRKDKVRPGDILGALTGDAGGFYVAVIFAARCVGQRCCCGASLNAGRRSKASGSGATLVG